MGRIFRRPVVWIILVIIAAIALSSLFSSGPSYTKVDTSDMLAQLNSGNTQKVLVEDKEQTFSLDLNSPIKVKGTETDKIQAQVPASAIDDTYNQATKAKQDGKIAGSIDTKVTKDSVLLSLLVNLLPIAVL